MLELTALIVGSAVTVVCGYLASRASRRDEEERLAENMRRAADEAHRAREEADVRAAHARARWQALQTQWALHQRLAVTHPDCDLVAVWAHGSHEPLRITHTGPCRGVVQDQDPQDAPLRADEQTLVERAPRP